MPGIELNSAFKQALQLIEDSTENLFLTGKAGTGKSTLLTYLKTHTKKSMTVLAPTGVAALNVQGETIHAFFRFKPTVTPETARKTASKIKNNALYKEIKLMVIDEISMVRADLLDCVDTFLQTVLKNKNPFGGIQMVFIGDLYQLPPVVTSQEKYYFTDVYSSPYFFSARVMTNPLFKLNFIELEKIYRQKDADFIELLNAIRNNSITAAQLKQLNSRVKPAEFTADTGYIYLTSTNQEAEQINTQKLTGLKTKLFSFIAEFKGDFKPKDAPTDTQLQLKVGAQVMFLNNDAAGRWVNGTTGEVIKIIPALEDETIIQVRTHAGTSVMVTPYQWSLYRYQFDRQSKVLSQEKAGSFIQYPLKLAWAITIHKSQGKTFDKVIIDLARGTFAHGQSYVALSRCKAFTGMILKHPFKKSHILMDARVRNFLTGFQYSLAEQRCSSATRQTLLTAAANSQQSLKIVYLKANDQKSTRVIKPIQVGEMEYLGKKYLAVTAYCQQRQENRTFRVDRILEIDAL